MLDLQSLPDAILSAERLSGTIVPVGAAFWPLIGSDSLSVRVLAAMHPYQPGTIFSGHTAAWIWGAQRTPPSPFEYSVDSTNRIAISSRVPFVKRELTFLEGDVVEREGRLITSPIRTVFDLLQQPDEAFERAWVAIRVLLLAEGCSREEVLHRLARSPRIPNSRLLRRRLAYDDPTTR